MRPVTAESFAEALELAADLGDEELMGSAWSSRDVEGLGR